MQSSISLRARHADGDGLSLGGKHKAHLGLVVQSTRDGAVDAAEIFAQSRRAEAADVPADVQVLGIITLEAVVESMVAPSAFPCWFQPTQAAGVQMYEEFEDEMDGRHIEELGRQIERAKRRKEFIRALVAKAVQYFAMHTPRELPTPHPLSYSRPLSERYSGRPDGHERRPDIESPDDQQAHLPQTSSRSRLASLSLTRLRGPKWAAEDYAVYTPEGKVMCYPESSQPLRSPGSSPRC